MGVRSIGVFILAVHAVLFIEIGYCQDTRYTLQDPFNRQFDNNNNRTTSEENDDYNRRYYPSRDSNTISPNTGGAYDQYNRSTTTYRDPFNRDNDYYNRNPNYNKYDDLPVSRPSYNRNPVPRTNVLVQDATYFIVASKMVRPGLIYKVEVNVLKAENPIVVRSSISRNGVELTADSKVVKENVPETLLMRVRSTSEDGDYKLRIEGLYNEIGAIAFQNETTLTFSQRSMTIFVQTDKPVYMQGELVRFRIVPITVELKGFNGAIDVYMIDPSGHILRRWLSRQSNLGTVSLEYKLADQPKYGEWRIRVNAIGQIEETAFTVEEYYQTRFEVNVTMPAFFFNTDPYIYGKVMANFTSGAPTQGNLTLKATIRPIGWFKVKDINDEYRIGRVTKDYRATDYYMYNQDKNYAYQDFHNADPNYQTTPLYNYQDQYLIERYFNFEEEWPFWMQKPEGIQSYDPVTQTYKSTLPFLRFFNGTYEFKYPMSEILQLMPNVNVQGMEVMITATVGEKFYDEIISGYSMSRVYNSSIKVSFLGDSPQVFKPSMPFKCYVVAEYHDSSPVEYSDNYRARMEITGSIEGTAGGREYPLRNIYMSEKPGVWEVDIDIRNDLNLDESRSGRDFLNGITAMKLRAYYSDDRGQRAETEVYLVSHYSPQNRQIKIGTSTRNPRVGEYIIFHVQTNYFIESFSYVIISKGVVLLSGQEPIQENIKTIAVTLSAEMAPVATIVVWNIQHQGHIVADSLTFPVNGISRNNFTVYVNNRKTRTGEKVEVGIFGEPGAYVGLSAIDNAFYTMQAGNELTYAKVISKMSQFDEQTNGTHKQTWRSHHGQPDELIYYPSSSFGIDANRTFEYVGLVVFTDVVVPRKYSPECNFSLGLAECLSGSCYRIQKKCDGYFDCNDGSDEINCNYFNETSLLEFRKYRFNRIQRHYENVWLWKDINIGPHGRYMINIDVPSIPALWMVSAFSVSPSNGFGMMSKAIEYVGVRPFFMNIEMPDVCKQGEQMGIRVTVFNYMTDAIEATVVLHGSPDYQFVHVEAEGIVRSYNPRTSFGEHQFFIYLESQETTVVYVPIVPQRLGDIDVTLHAQTLLGTDQITRRFHVEADGLPQYRHQAILLDLSTRAYVFQYMHVNITERPDIPYEVERYFVYGSNKARISVVGDVVGPIFPTIPVNATSLLTLPMDSGEQNMFSFAANLYTVQYMRLINQRNKTMEKHAFRFMNIGYQRQLSFMNPDGSFSLFRSDWNNSEPSVWLTAYCARIFQEASFYEFENFIYIDPTLIHRSVQWLLSRQLYDGSFYEQAWSADRKMNSSFSQNSFQDKEEHRNISLTAQVLIALATVKDLSGDLGSQVATAQRRAKTYLEHNLEYIGKRKQAYETAVVAYALMLSKSSKAETAFRLLSRQARTIGEYMYWGNKDIPQPPTKLENQKYFSLPRLPYEYDATNIEATAYALLIYVSRRDFFLDPIVRWLNAQRLYDGGWASTQDTSVALKALIEYTVYSRIREVSSLSVTVEATSLSGQPKNFYITDKNIAVLQTLDIPNAWGTVKVQAKGAGYAILQMHVQYNVDNEKYQTKPPVPAFDLEFRPVFHGRNQSHITMLSCQRWINTNESIRSGMTILDVAIPTGYYIQQQKLDSYVLSSRVRNLQRAKYEKNKVLFYFEYLDNEDVCVNFTIERWYPVANMSRYLPVRVYDYYAPERFNEKIFDALNTYLLNICEVCGSSQCPYCSIYNVASKAPISMALIIAAIMFVFVKQFSSTRVRK